MMQKQVLGFGPPARLEQVGDKDSEGVQNRIQCTDFAPARESKTDAIFGKDMHEIGHHFGHSDADMAVIEAEAE